MASYINYIHFQLIYFFVLFTKCKNKTVNFSLLSSMPMPNKLLKWNILEESINCSQKIGIRDFKDENWMFVKKCLKILLFFLFIFCKRVLSCTIKNLQHSVVFKNNGYLTMLLSVSVHVIVRKKLQISKNSQY